MEKERGKVETNGNRWKKDKSRRVALEALNPLSN